MPSYFTRIEIADAVMAGATIIASPAFGQERLFWVNEVTMYWLTPQAWKVEGNRSVISLWKLMETDDALASALMVDSIYCT